MYIKKMLNTRAIDEGLRRKKPDLKAYGCLDDERFEVSACMILVMILIN